MNIALKRNAGRIITVAALLASSFHLISQGNLLGLFTLTIALLLIKL
jgi:hypothetical protein